MQCIEGSNKTYLLEKSLLEPAVSCEGEPAPERVVPAILPDGFKTPDMPNGDLTVDAPDESTGGMLVVGEVERPLAVLGG